MEAEERHGGRKPDELSIMIAEATDYLDSIGHPVTLPSIKGIVLEEIGTGPKIKWGPIDVQQAVKTYLGMRIRGVLKKLGYAVIEGETWERVLRGQRSEKDVREGVRYLKQLRRYDENRIRYEEGILALMRAHHTRSEDMIPEKELDALYEKIYG